MSNSPGLDKCTSTVAAAAHPQSATRLHGRLPTPWSRFPRMYQVWINECQLNMGRIRAIRAADLPIRAAHGFVCVLAVAQVRSPFLCAPCGINYKQHVCVSLQMIAGIGCRMTSAVFITSTCTTDAAPVSRLIPCRINWWPRTPCCRVSAILPKMASPARTNTRTYTTTALISLWFGFTVQARHGNWLDGERAQGSCRVGSSHPRHPALRTPHISTKMRC